MSDSMICDTYRFARNGTLRSVMVLAQRINVKTNDKKTVVTSAKNAICIGHVVRMRYQR